MADDSTDATGARTGRDRPRPGQAPPQPSRRRYLRTLGAVPAIAIPHATTGRVVGRGSRPTARSADDGVPLVWTRLPDGTPERGRQISPERHRRLRVYCDLDVPALLAEYDPLVAVSVVGRSGEEAPRTGEEASRPGEEASRTGDDGGLSLALLVDRATPAVRRSLPDRLDGVPTTTVEWRYRPTPSRVCRSRVLTLFDPVVGGIATYGRRDGEGFFDGTVGTVCWDADDGALCLVTAAHVASQDGEYTEALYQEGRDDTGKYREQRIATHAAHSEAGSGGLDVAKYRIDDGVRAGPLASVGREQPDVTGRWDFAGLADATAGGEIPVSLAGRSTCYAEGACVGTFRSDLVDYAARITPQVATGGDSGGAFLDERGRLVALFTHRMPGENSGPVGEPALSRVGARLSPPD